MLERLFRLIEQPNVLDGDDRLVGEGLEQGELLLGEGPHLPAIERDGAKITRLAHQGHGEQGSQSVLLDGSDPERIPPAIQFGLAHVEELSRLPGPARPKQRPAEAQRFLQQGPELGPGTADLGGPEQLVASVTPEHPELSAHQGQRLVEDRREDRLEVGRGARDHPQDVSRGRLLLECLFRLVEQADVLDRDDRLVGEGLR